jgi:hypothetical protein
MIRYPANEQRGGCGPPNAGVQRQLKETTSMDRKGDLLHQDAKIASIQLVC